MDEVKKPVAKKVTKKEVKKPVEKKNPCGDCKVKFGSRTCETCIIWKELNNG